MGDREEQPVESAVARLERLRRESEGRRVVTMPLLAGFGHLVLDAGMIQEIFTNTSLIRPPFFRKAIGKGLIVAEGDRWTLSRRTVQPELSPRTVGSMGDLVRNQIALLLEEWSDPASDGSSIPLVTHVTETVFRIALTALFGCDVGAHDPRARSVIRLSSAYNELTGLGVFDSRAKVGAEMLKTIQTERATIDSLGRDLVQNRRESRAPGCPGFLIDKLMDPAFTDRPIGPDQCPIGGDGLIEEIVLMLLASVETTTASTINTIDFLSQHPDAVGRLRDEAAETPCEAAPTDRPWLLACFRESLRLRPPVWFNGRYATEEIEFSTGDVVGEGDHIYVCPYLMHREPSLWDHPDLFDPDRFFEKSIRESAAFMPFGLGRHYCVGSGLATLVATSFVSAIFGGFDVSIHEKSDGDPRGGFLLGPDLDVRATLTPI